MPLFYLDTSTLVKRYRREQGTEVVEDALESSFGRSVFHVIPVRNRTHLYSAQALERPPAARRHCTRASREVSARPANPREGIAARRGILGQCVERG